MSLNHYGLARRGMAPLRLARDLGPIGARGNNGGKTRRRQTGGFRKIKSDAEHSSVSWDRQLIETNENAEREGNEHRMSYKKKVPGFTKLFHELTDLERSAFTVVLEHAALPPAKLIVEVRKLVGRVPQAIRDASIAAAIAIQEVRKRPSAIAPHYAKRQWEAGARRAAHKCIEAANFRVAKGKWAGGDHTVVVKFSHATKLVSAKGTAKRAWSANGKWAGKNSELEFVLPVSWIHSVHRVLGPAVVPEPGSFVLRVFEASDGLVARVAVQGRGFTLRIENRRITRKADGTYVVQKAVRRPSRYDREEIEISRPDRSMPVIRKDRDVFDETLNTLDKTG